MILPGTLVQYVGDNSRLRPRGIYTTRRWEVGTGFHQPEDGGPRVKCDAGALWLCETLGPTYGGAFCACRFRIIAPPITEADRLEASAPVNDAPAKPKRVRA